MFRLFSAKKIGSGRGALQDIDQHAMLRPHCKWTVSVKRVKDMVPTIRKAFDIAQSGIPGPVFVETPLDILWPAAELLDGLGLGAGVILLLVSMFTVPRRVILLFFFIVYFFEKPNFEWTMDSAMKVAEYYYLKRFFNNVIFFFFFLICKSMKDSLYFFFLQIITV